LYPCVTGPVSFFTRADSPPLRRLVRDGCERLRLERAVVRAADATDVEAIKGLLRDESDRESADAVLVDAPCSGLGTLRRHPELRSKTQHEFDAHAQKLRALQTKLIDAAAELVVEVSLSHRVLCC